MEIRTLVFVYDVRTSPDSDLAKVKSVFGEPVTDALIVENSYLVLKTNTWCNLVKTVSQINQVRGQVWSIPYENLSKLNSLKEGYIPFQVEVKNASDGTRFTAMAYSHKDLGISMGEVDFSIPDLIPTYAI